MLGSRPSAVGVADNPVERYLGGTLFGRIILGEPKQVDVRVHRNFRGVGPVFVDLLVDSVNRDADIRRHLRHEFPRGLAEHGKQSIRRDVGIGVGKGFPLRPDVLVQVARSQEVS